MITVKKLISKLSKCNLDWKIMLTVDFTKKEKEFYIKINKKEKIYNLIQGVNK